MKKILITFLLPLLYVTVNAQHQELNEKPGLWKNGEKEQEDTLSLIHAFKKGKVHGHFRYFFMATDNAAGLTDYYANAAGGGLKYETAPYKKFQLGISGFFAFNIGSSNLAKPDAKTNQLNRYEIGLFDIEDPNNKKDIDRLEELYLKYHFKKSNLTFGKQLLNTPFINLQDGRMRPTEVEGLWAEINEIKKTRLELGYLYGISPRSTVKWYKAGASVGVYPVGVNPDGSKSGYRDNLKSNGILLTGITHELNKNLKLQLWDLYADNIFNSVMLQADYDYSLTKTSGLIAAVQVIRQDAVNNGGNEDATKTYFKKSGKAWTFGGKTGWKNDRWETTLNYTRITGHGRYLMPREWGRDPFFTFLPRERNEGLGDVHAIMGKINYKIPSIRFTTSAAFGHYNLPDVTNFALNKYGLPSYNQLNIDARYKFAGLLKGLETQLLFVYKNKTGNSYNNDKYVINKVDMSLWNMVINYQF
ncbi:MAG: OprD family outer membrane porin [Chitinophagaceae bacterium]